MNYAQNQSQTADVHQAVMLAQAKTDLERFGQQKAAVEQTPMEQQIGRYRMEVGELRDLVTNIAQALTPVLTPVPETEQDVHGVNPASGPAGQVAWIPAPLVSEIDSITDSLAEGKRQLWAILQRLQI